VKEALSEARSIYQPSSFVVKSLEQKKAALEPLLLASQLRALDTALQVNSDQINSTKLELRNLRQDFLRQPALMKGFEELQSRLALVQGNLAALTSAQESFRLELAQNSVPWRLLSPPRMNPIPIEPSMKTGLLKAILIGVASGLGIGVLRDRIDHVFHNPEEVNDDPKLPLLGHIPHVEFFQGVREDKRFLLSELDDTVMNSSLNNQAENKSDISQQRYQRFFYQEAFRNLFTSIRFLNSDQPLKTIALTSSVPAEGKSLVNILLAKTLSEMGQSVLLIDADLRKPQVHTRLGLNNLAGLSNILAEDNQSWQDAIQSVPGYSNWFAITAGRRPPDPTRLLSSKRMHEFVENIAESCKFDLILFDTPPILGLADAALVAEKCNGLMLLVSLNRVDRSLPKQAANRILSSGAALLGIVTNGISASTQSNAYGYGKYRYGKYSYGNYGYGAYDPTATYAHYANTEDENTADQENSAGDQRRNWRKPLSKQAKRFMRWIDG
jgi:capsular exopolysaccharide synthesis family protein